MKDNDSISTVSNRTIYHTIIPQINHDKIPIDNLLYNLRCIIQHHNVIDCYNQVVAGNIISNDIILELLNAYYYSLNLTKPQSKKIAKLDIMIFHCKEANKIYSCAEQLYILHYISNIDFNDRTNSDQDLIDRLYL